MSDIFDYILVGGGLQSGLIALAVRANQPGARIAVIERGAQLGGNHTWCFHARDVSAGSAPWVDPLVVRRWTGYDVRFPDHERRLDTPYACVTSESLAAHVHRALARAGSSARVRTTAVKVASDEVEVTTSDGGREVIRGRAVIDARGPDRLTSSDGGWQKFLGQEVRLAAPHGLDRPILMDALVAQVDGFRFFYVLPLAEDRLLIEDTYFNEGSHVDVSALRSEIASYATRHGWRITSVEREETGVLPMPISPPPPSAKPPLVAGYAGSWFHPVTAYSFPIATRLAEHVGTRAPDQLFGPALDELAREHARQLAFGGKLNHMMFRWYPPDKRHHILARFYRLPQAVVERFYALELTTLDRARIFVGRPPRGLSLRSVMRGSR
ncbi:MAG: lycopene beta-cyclase CrtY [Kofleriaceae bacterium]|nr:lycopene beta-cyclase CrtY [Kofleriaceae bacterium]